MQLRFYWDLDLDDCVVARSTLDHLRLRVPGRLLAPRHHAAHRPLLDDHHRRAARQARLGARRPRRHGQDRVVKDLAKGIGMQCVVFNCSDQLDYKMMGKLFSGVAQCGCWTCLDEFNRIDIEVLSVVAQQLLTIRQALLQDVRATTSTSRGANIASSPNDLRRLHHDEPGLRRPHRAARQPQGALPARVDDGARLRAHRRDHALRRGLPRLARPLAQKMVKMYKLCSEQLSQQDHYDYGMRQVKSVLVMAGGQKRANPDLHENISLIRAMLEANVPRFLADDLPLFDGIIGDLYPNLEIPAVDYGALQWHRGRRDLVARGLQVVPASSSRSSSSTRRSTCASA